MKIPTPRKPRTGGVDYDWMELMARGGRSRHRTKIEHNQGVKQPKSATIKRENNKPRFGGKFRWRVGPFPVWEKQNGNANGGGKFWDGSLGLNYSVVFFVVAIVLGGFALFLGRETVLFFTRCQDTAPVEMPVLLILLICGGVVFLLIIFWWGMQLTTAGTWPGSTGCPGEIPICCMMAFFRARWFRPFISSWSLRCCGGWKYLHGGFSRLQRPCGREKEKGFISLNFYFWKILKSYSLAKGSRHHLKSM